MIRCVLHAILRRAKVASDLARGGEGREEAQDVDGIGSASRKCNNVFLRLGGTSIFVAAEEKRQLFLIIPTNVSNQNMPLKNFYCAYCGQSFSSVSQLTRAGLCTRHPDGPVRGKHKLYEGSEKAVYTCKYCGVEAQTIDRLTSSFCVHHPAGHNRGRHAPAL